MKTHRGVIVAAVFSLIALAALVLAAPGASRAFQDAWTPTPPAATLVPPTPMPTLTPTPFTPPTESALGEVQASGALRVGTLYNAFPFIWLDQHGALSGYEADILRAVGIELGLGVEFVQVTRQNADDMLLSGEVDVLIGQQVHTRDREALLDFTHPYYLNSERMVVRTDAPYATLQDMAGQPIAVEIGSRSERVLRGWAAQNGVLFDIRTYFTESAALDALASGDVSGMLGELDSLRRAGRQQMRLLDQPLLEEPYAISLRRWDVNLRNLLNRSLQRLKASGRLDQIFDQWFPEEDINFAALVPVYDLLYRDGRQAADFPADMPFPARPVTSRIEGGQPLRVAGLIAEGDDAPSGARMINALNRALVEEMARRWGVQVEAVPGPPQNAVDLVANGQADLAVGVSPVWDGADRVEYSAPYLLHGDRLMVPADSDIRTFADFLGTGWWIGYFADDALDADTIKKYAGIFNVEANLNEPFAIQRESEALYIMTVQHNVDAIYGDSLRLLALQRAADTPESVEILLGTPYGDDLPITFAAPRNDADFRSLVDFTLQDIAADGTYQRLWEEQFGVGHPLPILQVGELNPDARPGS